MINVEILNRELTDNPENIIKVMIRLGFNKDKIRYNERKHLITSTRPTEDSDNPNGFLLYTESLIWQYTTRVGNGNIYTLVMELKGLNFADSLNKIAEWLNIKASRQLNKIKLPFNSFYRELTKNESEPELNIKTYSNSSLPEIGLSYKYLKDGVSLITQEKYGIRYDIDSNAIITPIYDFYGRLIGAKARNNDPNCDYNHRFWAYLEYPKTLTLFGYSNNYKYIIQKKTLIIFEAEKSVMIADSLGMKCCVAVAGHNISDVQAKYIKMLGVEKIIIAFDEGVSKEELEYECKKVIVNNPLFKNKVGYINMNNILIEKDSKMSPIDGGEKLFKKLLKEQTVWVTEQKTED